MDFDDTPEEAAFRAEAHAWLSAHAELKQPGSGPGRSLGDPDPEAELEHIRRSKAWQRTLYDGGWAGITWPKEYGGRGGTTVEARVFAQEMALFNVSNGVFAQGIGMAGPTIIGHGTDAQRQRFLAPILRGDHVWCQLFSEPGAGSDLASLSTRAEQHDDEFLVNGQKVWTSSHFSDWGILLARTDFHVPKHKGITYFLVDMRTPGIEIRPLRQITGAAHFNEVFFTDVRIPAENVVGPVNDGWRVTVTTLTNERMDIGSSASTDEIFSHIRALATEKDRCSDPLVRQSLADSFIRLQLLKFLSWRVQTSVSRGEQPGPESSVLKLALSQQQARIGEFAMSLQGAAGGLLDYRRPDSSPWSMQFLSQWATRIGGGTEQIQRNIIGERVLGLPREPQVDRNMPFRPM
jgi:alkylation response protein AidB-like acyl-CoA dehydrogenase